LSSTIQLIVGLGNPGRQYEGTRHNVGFWFLDHLAALHHASLHPENKFHGIFGRCQIDGHNIYLLKPTTFMNDSGQSIQAVAKFYKIPATKILVAHDELDFPVGKIQLKEGGGHGGHNGLRSTMQHLSDGFWRLRIGIGHPGHKDLVHSYVLTKPNSADRVNMLTCIDEAVQLMPELIKGNFQKVMNFLHASN